MKYRHIYALLKERGHSPMKAAEIIIDAERGDKLAILWVRVVFGSRH